MTQKALAEYTRVSKYAKYLKDKKRRENWEEQVDRVMGMHMDYYGPKLNGIIKDVTQARNSMLNLTVLGSQRALQFGGTPILRTNERLYNCSASYIDRPKAFQEALFLLLCGCGVGVSLQQHHVNSLPKIHRPSSKTVTHTIADSIEGWADALGVLLSSYFSSTQPFPEYKNQTVVFDYSQIRPEGSPISWGGKSPNPAVLCDALEKIRSVIHSRLDSLKTKLRPIDCYDIIMHASGAVLAGGVRRSAVLCMFSPSDEEMMNAKTGDWYNTNPQRSRSNNSVALLRGSTSKEFFNSIKESTKQFGEPAFIWLDDRDALFNPCVEIGLYAKDDNDNSGWAFCNLCEINVAKCKTEKEFLQACESASVLGTLQAGYTSFKYLGKVSENIAKREALLGVSMTGMADNPKIAFNPSLQARGARRVLEVNEYIAQHLGINPCARATCIKPAGTTSCLLGTSSGIHPHHAKRYFRRVIANKNEIFAKVYGEANPHAIEPSFWNKNDVVLSFPQQAPDGAMLRKDLSALNLLNLVKLTQKNWVANGKCPERCVKPWLSHNVSNTITVKPEEWDQVFNYLYRNKHHFAGVSLLAESGDKDYPQAPFVEVKSTVDFFCEYHGLDLDILVMLCVSAKQAYNGDIFTACNEGVAGKRDDLHQIGTVRRWLELFDRFALKHMNGDKQKASNCIKDMYNRILWKDILNNHIDVSWAHISEEPATEYTELVPSVACQGGQCLI